MKRLPYSCLLWSATALLGCTSAGAPPEDLSVEASSQALTSNSFINQLIGLNPPDTSNGIAELGWDDEATTIEPAASSTSGGAARYQSRVLVNKAMAYMARHAPEIFAVHLVGHSYNGKEIRALHVRNPSAGNGNQATTPALLLECNMHAPEWLGSESCLRFLERLFAAYKVDPNSMKAFLSGAQLYVVPTVNADGRDFDDRNSGAELWSDPTDFEHWRKNRQSIHCEEDPDEIGIDLARNFSTGWAQPPAPVPDPSREQTCTDSMYHGDFPFQAPEAAALRRFVNNRTFSVSVSVHSNGAGFESTYSDSGERDDMRDAFAAWWNNVISGELSAVDPNYVLLNTPHSSSPGGTGLGQFSAWVSRPSHASTPTGALELDDGTSRAVSAFMLELPPPPSGNLAYEGSPYQHAAGDGSDTQHPSGASIIEEVPVAATAAFSYMIQQTRSPWCAIEPITFAAQSCPEVGLTGAKIAAETNAIGVLDFARRRSATYETVAVGSYGTVYRVQNFNSLSSAVNVAVSIESRPLDGAWSTDRTVTTPHVLAAGVAKAEPVSTTAFTYTSGRDYRVTVSLNPQAASDSSVQNNQHVFRFRAEPPAIFGLEHVWISDRSVVLSGVRSNQYVEIGADAEITRALESGGSAQLRSRATVGGAVAVHGALSRQTDTTVWGQTLEGQTIPALSIASLTITSVTSNVSRCNQVLDPGRYGDVVVESNCSLTLKSGTYELNRLVLRPDTELFVSGTVAVRTAAEFSMGDRSFVSGVADPADFALYSNQTNQLRIPVESRFSGIVTAPYAEVNVASRTLFYGAIAARDVRVDPDSTVVGAWEPISRTPGYVLRRAGNLANVDPTMTLPVARSDCQANKDAFYPAQNVQCSFDGHPIGYELYWDGARVGFEPTWSVTHGKSNCDWNRQQYPNKRVECYYDGKRLGYERYTNGSRVAFLPIATRQAAITDCLAQRAGNTYCLYDGVRLGYELYRNGARTTFEPSWSRQQAADNCQMSKNSYYPTESVACVYAGEPLGYELFWNGTRAGFEPKWSRARGRANCQWNRETYAHRQVDCSYDGAPIWFE